MFSRSCPYATTARARPFDRVRRHVSSFVYGALRPGVHPFGGGTARALPDHRYLVWRQLPNWRDTCKEKYQRPLSGSRATVVRHAVSECATAWDRG